LRGFGFGVILVSLFVFLVTAKIPRSIRGPSAKIPRLIYELANFIFFPSQFLQCLVLCDCENAEYHDGIVMALMRVRVMLVAVASPWMFGVKQKVLACSQYADHVRCPWSYHCCIPFLTAAPCFSLATKMHSTF
jgi:hypothetical protein